MKIFLFILLLVLFAALGEMYFISPPAPLSNPPPSELEAALTNTTIAPEAGLSSEERKSTAQNTQTAAASHVDTPEISSPPPLNTTSTAEKPSATAEDFVTDMEAEVVHLTNAERKRADLFPLAPNTLLRDIAALHSADMLANDYFSHENLNNCSSSCRATNAGYFWRRIGENIYMMSGYKLTPEKAAAMVVDGWMQSPGHRTNILSDSFEETGVGVASDGTHIYVTSLYATPR